MNIRKDIDYSEMYAELDKAMAADITQMELYCEIGKAVCRRTEKGAAVAAAAYLSRQYPDAQGFSPRNLRRMRDFYRSYQDYPALLSLAMELDWIQNVVILESGLSTERREWYIKAVEQFGWSKTELIANIAANAHAKIVLAIEEEVCYIVEQEEKQTDCNKNLSADIMNTIHQSVQRLRKWWIIWKGGGRRWHTMLWETFTVKQIASMRC